MEMESSRNDTGDSILRHTINFVYEEIMNQFLKYNGKTKKSTFWLINWGILIDEKSSGTNKFKYRDFLYFSNI